MTAMIYLFSSYFCTVDVIHFLRCLCINLLSTHSVFCCQIIFLFMVLFLFPSVNVTLASFSSDGSFLIAFFFLRHSVLFHPTAFILFYHPFSPYIYMALFLYFYFSFNMSIPSFVLPSFSFLCVLSCLILSVIDHQPFFANSFLFLHPFLSHFAFLVLFFLKIIFHLTVST